MMATAFMGYVLPWGQMSFAGATVITNLFTAIPLVGTGVAHWLWGGYAVGDPTLNRFFALHYLLPFMIVGVVVLHVWALHVVGPEQSRRRRGEGRRRDTVAFTPYATIKDMFAVCVFFVIYAWFVFFIPNYLLDADNYNPANPLVTPAHIVPEWYLLPFYAILRAIPNKLVGVLALGLAIVLLAFLPWLDTSPIKSGKYRPLFRFFFWIFVVCCVGLGYLGSQEVSDSATMVARILALGYFGYLLVVLPVLGLVEKTKPRAASIADAVLPKGAAPAE